MEVLRADAGVVFPLLPVDLLSPREYSSHRPPPPTLHLLSHTPPPLSHSTLPPNATPPTTYYNPHAHHTLRPSPGLTEQYLSFYCPDDHAKITGRGVPEHTLDSSPFSFPLVWYRQLRGGGCVCACVSRIHCASGYPRFVYYIFVQTSKTYLHSRLNEWILGSPNCQRRPIQDGLMERHTFRAAYR